MLSAILLDNDAINEILGDLSAEDFYVPAHTRLFESMSALHDAGQPVDLTTLSDYLKSRDLLDSITDTDISGLGYFRLAETAIDGVPTTLRPSRKDANGLKGGTISHPSGFVGSYGLDGGGPSGLHWPEIRAARPVPADRRGGHGL